MTRFKVNFSGEVEAEMIIKEEFYKLIAQKGEPLLYLSRSRVFPKVFLKVFDLVDTPVVEFIFSNKTAMDLFFEEYKDKPMSLFAEVCKIVVNTIKENKWIRGL